MITHIFHGQGIQKKGMGKELFSDFKNEVITASDILGYSLEELCMEDKNHLLNQTQYAQPVIYTLNAFYYWKKIREGNRKPDFLMGHSLGEYNALLAADVFDFETGLKIVAKRGELMSSVTGGKMAAVTGLESALIKKILEEYGLEELDIANYNSPLQSVISGPLITIQQAESIFKNEGAKGYHILNVSGPFHSRYYKEASNQFAEFLKCFDLRKPKIPVVSNLYALPYPEHNMDQIMSDQMKSPVRWVDSMQYVLRQNEMRVDEIGTPKILSRFTEQIKEDLESKRKVNDIWETFKHAMLSNKNEHIFSMKVQNRNWKGISGTVLIDEINKLGTRFMTFAEQTKIILFLPQSIEFITCLFSSMYANLVAVFLPVSNLSNWEAEKKKVYSIIEDSGAEAIVSLSSYASLIRQDKMLSQLSCIYMDQVEELEIKESRKILETDLAVLLYTSGSTSSPKGVMLTHKNLLIHAKCGVKHAKIQEDSRVLTWMPQYHSFGLSFEILSPILAKCQVFIREPSSFVENPVSWFYDMSELGITNTAAANFALKYCVDNISRDDLQNINLETLQGILCAGEKLHKEVSEPFTRLCKEAGAKNNPVQVLYGMSEAGDIVSSSEGGVTFSLFDKGALECGNLIETNNCEDGIWITSCGIVPDSEQVKIVNEETKELVDSGKIGEVWIHSDAVALGYYRNYKATKNAFYAKCKSNGKQYLRTGDLGGIKDNQLYLAGRSKETIIINGKKYYPVDLELTIRLEIPETTLPTVVFSVEEETNEKVVVVQEVESLGEEELKENSSKIIQAVAREYSVEVSEILFVNCGIIGKTSLGKLQRLKYKQKYLQNSLNPIYTYRQNNYFEEKKRTGYSIIRGEGIHTLLEHFIAEEKNIPPEQIDLEKSVYQYGFNSIEMIRLISVIKECCGYELTLKEIYKYNTLNELTSFLSDKSKMSRVSEQGKGSSQLMYEKEKRIPLSLGQKGLWMHQKTYPSSYAYNVPVCIRVGDSVHIDNFKRAVKALIQYNPILNSVIMSDKEICASLREDTYPLFENADVVLADGELENYLKEFFQKPFIMGQDLVMRIGFVTLDKPDGKERYFIACIHHIVLDGYSLEILLHQLWSLYQSYETGEQIKVQYNIEPYYQYVEEERKLLYGDKGNVYKEYWKEQFLAEYPQPDLGLRESGMAQIRMKNIKLDKGVLASIDEFGKKQRINPSVIFLLAYKVLLHRITGISKLVSEIPVMRRTSQKQRSLVGYFINIMPVRFELDYNMSIYNELQTLQNLLLNNMDYAAYPYPAIVKERRKGNQQIPDKEIHFGFAFQNYFEEWEKGEPDWVHLNETYYQTGDCEFSMEICEYPKKTVVGIKYLADVFDDNKIDVYLKEYQEIIYTIVKGKNMNELVKNISEEKIMNGKTVCDFLHMQAKIRPDKIAVVCGEQKITYEELAQKSSIVAEYLRANGLKAGDVVGLHMKKSINWMIGIFGILKARGVYLPLDIEYPVARLRYMFEDSNARCLLTNQESFEQAVTVNEKGRVLLQIEEAINYDVTYSTLTKPEPNDLAYMIYTSGSTGTPKGTLVEHRGIESLVQYFQNSNLIKPEDRVTQFYSMSFDASINEVFTMLSLGTQLHILLSEYTHDAKKYTEYCNQNEITVSFIPVSFMAILHPSKFRTLQTILTGGSEISVNLLRKWNPDFNYVNLYGPTEDTVISTAWSCLRGELPEQIDTIPIGKSIPGKHAYVLDEHLNELPIGERGEIFLGGVGLARGYLHLEQLTEEKFIKADGFSCKRLYHSGDIGYRGKDGNIYYVGRKDSQIKYHGYRIELEEIEKKIKEVSFVKDCAVLFLNKNGVERLVAYYVENETSSWNAQEYNQLLKEELESVLPHYMMPSFFIKLKEMPLTLNAKIDKNKLAQIELEQEAVCERSKPESPLQELLLAIWIEVLGVKDIGIDHQFFEAGGDSILAVVLAEKIESQLHISIQVTDIFQYPSIRKFANYLEPLLAERTAQDENKEQKEGNEQETKQKDVIPEYYEDSIAVIGISMKVPGADNAEQFWDNIRNGRESVKHLSPDELRKLGVAEDVIANPNYVPAVATIDYENCLDGTKFKLSPADMERMSPEFKLLLSHALDAVNNAGYEPSEIQDTGVFVTSSNIGMDSQEESFASQTYQKPGSIATMISYKLGFTGSSLYLQSNCSSSLAALHIACQSLRNYESTFAIVGGATVSNEQTGYIYRNGMTKSKTGHVKAFSADADGMIGGDGVVVFLLKRAIDAIKDEDNIYAIIRGSAMNNDGSDKVGFFAPSVNGQKNAIIKALDRTGINPESIQYIEAHGTGTLIGDPIEVSALTEAYKKYTSKRHFCGIGSVKSNIGHLDSVSGLAGSAKVILSLCHEEIPPSINVKELNPKIDFENSPFYVTRNLDKWKSESVVKRAGVSSFGIGGTNVHVLFESYTKKRQLGVEEKMEKELNREIRENKEPYNNENLQEEVLNLIADVLKMKPEDLREDKAFADIGVDSICGVDLVEKINEKFGVDLSVTVIYDYPRTLEFADYVLEQYKKHASITQQSTQNDETSKETGLQKEPIAIVGASGRFAESDTLEELWGHLEKKHDLVMPVKRWNVATEDSEGNSVCHNGSLLERLDTFDPLFFNISGLEATYMDPQQRIFLEECWKALEDAGYAGNVANNEKVGVYVASTTGDYQERFDDDAPAQALWGNMNSIVPSRIAYFLNLKGPAISVDTACSSSLVAVHLACQGLWMRETNMALAGGVSLQCTPKMYLAGNKGNMLSASGYCHTFDAKADGFVPGEGAAVIVLKRLQDAIEDGDYIHGVIVGSGINQDGATNGITAPSTISQTELERSVYEEFHIHPEDIQMIENHGTGTILGDPIEFQALTNAFRQYTQKKQFCALGSIKTNIGHTQHTSGVAGILKILLSLKNKKIPASLHFEKKNPNINFDDSPFYVNTELRDWSVALGKKRMAAVSAFGFGGTNAHVVIEEAPKRMGEQHQGNKRYMFALSAMNKEQLKKQAENLVHYFQQNPYADCGNISYTLLCGRKHFSHRLAFWAKEIKEAEELLSDWIRKDGDTQAVYYGISEKKETVYLDEYGDESQLQDYVTAGEIVCTNMFSDEKYCKLSLPCYPFKKESYWIEEKELSSGEKQISESKQYSMVLTGDEFYLKYHKVNGRKILPGSAYLEIAHNYIKRFVPDQSDNITLQDIVWLNSISLENGAVQVTVEIVRKADNEIEFQIFSENNVKKEKILNCQGMCKVSALTGAESAKQDLYLDNWTKSEFEQKAFYKVLEEAGIQYGLPFQCVKEVYKKDEKTLIRLELPDEFEGTIKNYMLHPSVLDAAFQSISLADMSVQELEQEEPAMLFAIKELAIKHSLTSRMWVQITKSEENIGNHHDILMINENGDICCSIKNISSRTVSKKSEKQEKDYTGKVKWLLPRWMPEEPVLQADKHYNETLVINGSSEDKIALSALYNNLHELTLKQCRTQEDIQKQLQTMPFIEHVIFITPEEMQEKTIEQQQREGVISLLRVVKAFLALGYKQRELDWTIITCMAQKVEEDDCICAGYASIHGMAGSLAKEMSEWKVKIVDRDQKSTSTSWETIELLGYDKRGDAWSIRNGHWFRHKVVSLLKGIEKNKPFREKGVYVLIGGAGSIGVSLSKSLITKYQSEIFWIGRRAEDSEVRSKREALSEYGNMPHYISVDATKQIELAEAIKEIKKQYPVIHGVIHLAQTDTPGEISDYEEEQFYQSIASKVIAGKVVSEVFKDEPLDFLFFMSSINAFSKAPQQAAYAAACTFIDSYVEELQSKLPYPVKSLNLGYFKNNIASKTYLKRTGYDLLNDQEVFEGITSLLASSFIRLGYMKIVSNICLPGLGYSKYEAACAEKENPPVRFSSNMVMPEFPKERTSDMQAEVNAMDELMLQLFWGQIKSMGVFEQEKQTLNEIIEVVKPYQFYSLWLEESLRLFVLAGYLRLEGKYYYRNQKEEASLDELWEKWRNKKQVWNMNKSLKAQSELVEQNIFRIPDILTGKTRATDIMFPKASMKLVESVYKSNIEGNYFNELVANTVSRYIEERIKENRNAKIRIFEVGAGTGSTSVVVFKALQKYREYVEEYCYTDVSRAFLIHAQNNYEKENPYLTYRIFDASKQISKQDITPNEYDIVIGANCLHTTNDICETIRNVKGLLKKNGLILINEMNENNLFSHLTFGMLEGWWLYTDKHLRITGCPGISSGTWKEILSTEGFFDIKFQADSSLNFQQEVIVGVSDGITYKEHEENMHYEKQISVQEMYEEENEFPENKPEVADTKHLLLEGLKEKLADIMAECLRISRSAITYEDYISDYGVDSILSVNLVKNYNEAFNISMDSTTLFEYSTIQELADYMIENYTDSVSRIIQPQQKKVIQQNKIQEIKESKETVVKTLEVKKKETYQDTQQATVQDRDIAIVGISAAFPMADTIQTFWKNIMEQKESLSEITQERIALWKDEREEAKALVGTKAGLLSNITQFDAELFGVTKSEAKLMSPEQRLLLLHISSALEDAGVTAKIRNQISTGLFAAVNFSDYGKIMSGHQTAENIDYSPSLPPSLMINKISYLLNLQGPSECCETGCSSVLVALQRAVKAILNGECKQSVVAGVNLILSQEGFQNLGMYGLLSKEGNSRPFQDNADGYVRSEAVGAFVLKPLRQAKKDRDNIYAVIKGSAVGHGGKGISFAAPNVKGMKNVIINAYQEAGISMAQVPYIEAHGIGNALSDNAEMNALKSAYQQMSAEEGLDYHKTNTCTISSIKPNLGHSETASGVAALLKAIFALKTHIIPGTLGFRQLSKDISFENTPFQITSENKEWVRERTSDGKWLPRMASVNSYGLGGVNAHVVLQEYEKEESGIEDENTSKQIVILSAHSKVALDSAVEQLYHFVHNQKSVSISDLAYTLQVTREAEKYRFATVIESREELLENLAAYQQGLEQKNYVGMKEDITNEWNQLFSEGVGSIVVKTLFEKKQYEKLAFFWVKGNEVEWKDYCGEKQGHKIAVPVHAFELKDYWNFDTQNMEADKKSVKGIIAELVGLEYEQIDEQKDFSEYGIDSFMLMPFLKKLQDWIHPAISFKDIEGCTNIGDMIERLSSYSYEEEKSKKQEVNARPNSWSEFPELIRLNEVTQGRPIFWFHAALGGVESYKEIAKCSSRPFYGIQARGWTTNDKPICGVKNMAKYYLEIVEKVQPNEKYDLGGFCLGGILAYEVARLLQKKGKKVSSIVMIDSPDGIFQKLLKESVPPKSPYRNVVFQTVNMLLIANGLENHLIKREECEDNCTEEQFLNQMIDLAIKHGIKKERKQFLETVKRNAAVQMAYEIDKYKIKPLSNKKKVRCTYFKNKNQVFQGNSKEYSEYEEQNFSLDKKNYWSEWEKQFEKFDCIEVSAENHLAIMQEKESLNVIVKKCKELYGDKR